jgi:antitoxin component of MazEF toxin-antitoxin module
MHTHPLPASTPAIRAKVVRVGNSVGVRLPASLHLALGTDVELTVRAVNVWPEGYFEMEPVGEDFVVPQRESAEAHENRIKRLFGGKGSL